MRKSNSLPPAGHYNSNYGNFQTELYAQVRHEAFGEDIGQNSWLTSDEQDRFLESLNLYVGARLLDVACGAGGPALRIAAITGCSIVGIDVHEQAVTTANLLAGQRGLAERAEFRSIDATAPLPFSDSSFDAITCIDAINHFSNRQSVIAEWVRLLKPGGRLLFTDPITLTGPLTNAEVATRSSAGFYLFVPHGYIDRVNVSFANLRMSADLGFSDRVYGLGVGMFYLTYVLLEIPGAIIAERWSARKWIARIMISWGIVTAFTGFVHTAGQFYAARFLLGVAESSFFPAMIVYLTHWFRLQERGRAIACLYAAVPAASLIGSPLAGWLLGVHWRSLAGWRWLFILEGIPAIVLGIITIFYLTDWPSQARWLPDSERNWLVNELQAELAAKKKKRNYTM